MKIITIPSSLGGLGKTAGAEQAPEAIIAATKKFYLNEQGRAPVFERINVPVVASNLSETNKNIFAAVKSMKNNFIVLGGDHAITYSAVKAFAENNPGAGLIVFDAHPDMMQPFSQPTHENWLRMLIEEGIVPAERVILVGVRNWDKEEYYFIKNSKIKNFVMHELVQDGIQETCDAVMAAAKDFTALYISVDIDVVDAAFAPGTGYQEPGGMSSRDLLYFLRRLRMLKNFKAADLVEINPPKDLNGVTVNLGAKVIVELM